MRLLQLKSYSLICFRKNSPISWTSTRSHIKLNSHSIMLRSFHTSWLLKAKTKHTVSIDLKFRFLLIILRARIGGGKESYPVYEVWKWTSFWSWEKSFISARLGMVSHFLLWDISPRRKSSCLGSILTSLQVSRNLQWQALQSVVNLALLITALSNGIFATCFFFFCGGW